MHVKEKLPPIKYFALRQCLSNHSIDENDLNNESISPTLTEK